MAQKKQATALLAVMKEDASAPVVTPLDINKLRVMVQRLGLLQAHAARLTKDLEEASNGVKQLCEVDIPTVLDEVGVTSIRVDDHLVSVETKYFPNVVKANEAAFFEWLRKTGHDDLIKNEVKVVFGRGEDEVAAGVYTDLREHYDAVTQKQTVHAQTLRAFVREQMEAGAELPPVLDINPVRTAIVK